MSSLPDTSNLVRRELLLYLEAHSRIDGTLPTRCPPWTVDDVTKHLAATFERFANLLAQGRRGDMTPPFHPDDLSRVNLQAVTDFIGDPDLVLADEAEKFLEMVVDVDELMPHQVGAIPVAMQLLFGLADLAIHHDDIAVAADSTYKPGNDVVETLDDAFQQLGRYEEGQRDPNDLWGSVLRVSGR